MTSDDSVKVLLLRSKIIEAHRHALSVQAHPGEIPTSITHYFIPLHTVSFIIRANDLYSRMPGDCRKGAARPVKVVLQVLLLRMRFECDGVRADDEAALGVARKRVQHVAQPLDVAAELRPAYFAARLAFCGKDNPVWLSWIRVSVLGGS